MTRRDRRIDRSIKPQESAKRRTRLYGWGQGAVRLRPQSCHLPRLARHGVLESNPAAPVRGPAYTTKRGKAPFLTAAEAKRLIESIDADNLVGLRDRVLIAIMVYSFARISAAVGMDLEDLVQTAGRSWLRLHEKGGEVHEMPVHHRLPEYLDAYIAALGRTGKLGAERLSRHDAYTMVRAAGDQGRGHRKDR